MYFRKPSKYQMQSRFRCMKLLAVILLMMSQQSCVNGQAPNAIENSQESVKSVTAKWQKLITVERVDPSVPPNGHINKKDQVQVKRDNNGSITELRFMRPNRGGSILEFNRKVYRKLDSINIGGNRVETFEFIGEDMADHLIKATIVTMPGLTYMTYDYWDCDKNGCISLLRHGKGGGGGWD